MLEYKKDMSEGEIKEFERQLRTEYLEQKTETDKDLSFRIGGVAASRGSDGFQFVGYTTLQQFYRGDQWDHNEAPGASQSTDNYCSVIVDNFASLLFDAPVEINCPSADETDDLLEMKAEMKEKLLSKVYDENDADDIVFQDCSKVGSLYGDAFIKGPMLDKNGSEDKKDWSIRFYNVDNPANIRLIFADGNFTELYGFIDTTEISPLVAEKKYGVKMRSKGSSITDIIKNKLAGATSYKRAQPNIMSQTTGQKMLLRSEYWTKEVMGLFIEDELVDWWWHDWGFIPLQYIKNNYSPNHPYGKSDLEDAIDPQILHTRVRNDLANAVKFLSTINLKGKNLDGMEVLVHGLSKIFNMPDEGELDPIQRSGDPYATGSFVNDTRTSILDVSGISEALMSTVSNVNPSGRAMSMALQSVIRKLNPRIKRYQKALKDLNKNILKLMEIYWPETKEIIVGDYSNEVSIISTLLRNIIDELNKFQSGVQSLTTTQKNLGIPQPKIEQKRMKKDLMDPILGPQTARQPQLIPQLQNPEGQAPTPGSNGEEGLQAAPNQAGSASPAGAIAAANQQAAGGALPANQIIE